MKNQGGGTKEAARGRMSRLLVFAGLALTIALIVGAIASAATSVITAGKLVLKISYLKRKLTSDSPDPVDLRIDLLKLIKSF